MQLRLLQPVNDRHGSHAWWSDSPNGILVVFIHGFTGNSLTTWVQFPVMLSRVATANVDFVFFGHNGGTSQMQAMVGLLSDAVERLWNEPTKFSSFPSTRQEFRFRRIILCAHSMGCVVARDTVLAAVENERAWAENAELVLFSPAHKGISDTLLRLEKFAKIFGPITQWPMEVFYMYYPVVRDLRPGSRYLRNLERRTNTAWRNETYRDSVVARAIVFGEYDNTVEQDRFSHDPYPNIIFPGRGHLSVCKPMPLLFENPYDTLVGCL